jgi:hypothetical protein
MRGRFGVKHWFLSVSLVLVSASGCLCTLRAQDHPKNYTFEEFLNAPNEELLAHKKKLDAQIELKTLNIPQSQGQ